MKKTSFQVNQKKPEIDVNKPAEKKFWQKQGPFSIFFLSGISSLRFCCFTCSNPQCR
jgi:hypothetical protein